jgi:hypothetical protein
MRQPGRVVDSGEFETFSVAVGAALVAGGLSLLASFLAALTGTLVALAVASWVTFRSQQTSGRREFIRGGRGVGLSILGVGTAVFLFAPVPLVPIRGLLLAAALLPLWWTERRGSIDPDRPGRRP